MEELPDVLCINCENMIDISKIEAHSSICLTPTLQVIRIIHSSELHQTHFKLSKLKSAIEVIAYYGHQTIPSTLRSELEYLIQRANELLRLTEATMESVEKSAAITSQIRILSASLPVKYLVYADRLKVLSLQQTYCFINTIRSSQESVSKSRMIFHKHYESRAFPARRKSGTFDCEQGGENIDEISSQMEQRFSIRSSIGSPREEDSSRQSEKMKEVEVALVPAFKDKTELKKYFYSKCLIVKFSFSSRHPEQYIQIPELYEKITKDNVPVEWWEETIRDEFKHPERWINLDVFPHD